MAKKSMAVAIEYSSDEEMEVFSVEPIISIPPSRRVDKGKGKVVRPEKKKASAALTTEKLMQASVKASEAVAKRLGTKAPTRAGQSQKKSAPILRVEVLDLLSTTAQQEGWLKEALPVVVAKRAREVSSAELRSKMTSSFVQLIKTRLGVLELLEREKTLAEEEREVTFLQKEVKAMK